MAQTLTIEQGLVLANRYELIQRVATGGMAQVWIATDNSSNQSVAIKILHQHLASDEAFQSRFEREALRAKQLEHQSIVKIVDTLKDPISAIVMEYIRGRNLRDVLDSSGPMVPKKAMELGVEIAGALALAHDAGVIHRDIKPANIMLQENGQSVITDFGIAKATGDMDLTETGNLLGTAKYVAPEQINGGEVDSRSDLYSLATVLYEAITGQVPFQGETDAEVALARLHATPTPPSEIAPGLDLGYDHFFNKALATNASARFETAEEFAQAAHKTAVGTFVPKPSMRGYLEDQVDYSNHRTNWILGAIGGCVLLGSFILALWLLVISIIGFGDTNTPRPLVVEQVSILAPTDDGVVATQLAEPSDNFIYPVTQPGESILLELTRENEISEVGVRATGEDWLVRISLFDSNGTLSEPLATVAFDSSTSVELPDSVDAEFVLVEFGQSEGSLPQINQVILN